MKKPANWRAGELKIERRLAFLNHRMMVMMAMSVTNH
jgi:hypothetical protein